MNRHSFSLLACLLVSLFCVGADEAPAPSLTIYNQDFAVVRQEVPLDLQAGTTSVRLTDITAHVEPDSVILRDPSGKHPLQVLEQNYRADPVSEALLLSLYEGKTISFLVRTGDKQEVIPGKIIRSGYVPHDSMAESRFGAQYYQSQMAYAQNSQPIVEIDGKVRFGLPGTPMFPALADDAVLKPTLQWLLGSEKSGPMLAELSYVTGGMTWQADYNIVAPEKGDLVDIVGWVTMDNQSGKDFENARIKLMAGDVNKLQPGSAGGAINGRNFAQFAALDSGMQPAVTEKAFDEYHLYSLARRTTLHDRETKQVEFVRANGVATKQVYIYDGVKIDGNRYNGWNIDMIRNNSEYGTESNPKIWVMREFSNSEANHLGMPLPKGRVRFYRRNDDGQMEFTGENVIDHTPRDEKIRIYTGNAFDLTGERRRTDYRVDNNKHTLDESFEIKLRNHKKGPVDIRVVEHLYRWMNWDVATHSDPFNKTDSKTIEFPVTIAPDEEKTIAYTAHYNW